MPNSKQLKISQNNAPLKPDAIIQSTVNATARESENDSQVVLFDGGQEITNGTVQKDGSYYDISSLDVENYNGKVYEDHNYGYRNVLGTVIGLVKDPVSNRVTIAGIRFSRSNYSSWLAKDLLIEGLVEFSIGTIGVTEQDGKRSDHRLVDLSIVGMGNNDHTLMEENSLVAVAVKNGFDLSKYKLSENGVTKMFKIYNINGFAVKVKINNAEGQETEVEVPAGGSVEAPTAEAQTTGQEQVDKAEAPKEDPAADPAENGVVSAADFKAVQNQLTELAKNMNTPAKPAEGAHVDTNGIGKAKAVKNEVAKMSAGQRLFEQIMLERNGGGAGKTTERYMELNSFNAEQLVAEGVMDSDLAHNAMTDDAGSVGGLIPPYELLDKIMQCVTQYDGFLSKFGFSESGLSYGWNLGIGDIEFTPVGYCDPSAESDMETALQNRTQERLATHTVICNKVSRFSPANVVNIVAGRYQTGYKKALAAFAIAEMQVAVDARVTGLERTGGTDIAADANGSLEYPATGQDDQAAKVLQLFTDLSDCVVGGVFVMNKKTAAKLILDFNLGATGIMSNTGTAAVNAYDKLGIALGGEIVVVPSTLLPTLGTDDTITVARTTEGGGNVTVDHAIFYLEAQNWYGVTNGALQFDIDSFGSYEVSVTKTVGGGGSGTVQVTETRSAKQRGETVLFGEMYRGGGILDFRQIGGVKAAFAA